ncbi:TPA: J domain-containing protein [Streptococcus suis]
MNMKSCWQELQIAATTDQRTIKLAYAERIKKVHPEEDPEGFKRLQHAYKSALQYAKQARPKPKQTFTEFGEQSNLENQQSATSFDFFDDRNENKTEDISHSTFDFSTFSHSEEIPEQEASEQTIAANNQLFENTNFVDNIKTACKNSPYYHLLYQILLSDEFNFHIRDIEIQKQLIAELSQLTFYGEEFERKKVIEQCELLGLDELALYLSQDKQKQLEDQFSTDTESIALAAEEYLGKLLSSLELVSDFYLLLKAFRSDDFRYFVANEQFCNKLTAHLLNYYFFGPWKHRIELVQLCQNYGLNELAGYIYWIGLNNPETQKGLSTERLV